MTNANLRAVNVGKTFGGIVALEGVSLEIGAGSVHALVGANGAGKSTLIKILTGYFKEYAGQVEIDHQPVPVTSPSDALQHGIEVVHQEVDATLVPGLSITENLLIEELAAAGSPLLLNWRKLNAAALEALARVGLQLDVRKPVEELSLHQKQLLVIARALSRNVRFLILDEPTASLSLPEVATLFDVLRQIKARGVGILYISHRLGEVREIADVISVLRNGRLAGNFPGDVDTAQVIEAMLGAHTTELYPPRRARVPGEVILDVNHLSRRGAVKDVSFSVRRHEVLGIAGLVGAGKTELLRLLFGADRADAGEIRLDGKLLRIRQPQDAVQNSIFLLPEERRKQGLLIENPIRENITLPFLNLHAVLGWVLKRRELATTLRVSEQVGLAPALPEMPVKNLSGGNQQKVVIGKWLGRTPRVMMFDEATQGIDVKTKRDVYDLALALSQTSGVIYASSDIDEVVALADRVLVMRDGRVVADLPAAQATRQLVLEYATGAKEQVNA
jgi:simple sugar transport system ATP-binding protein